MRPGNDKPIDAVAARVVSRGESFEFATPENYFYSATPLPTRRILPGLRRDPNFHDFTGAKVGRVTVVGLSEKLGRWVCRCLCGNYSYFHAKALRGGGQLSCDQCHRLMLAKKRDYFARTGKYLTDEEAMA